MLYLLLILIIVVLVILVIILSNKSKNQTTTIGSALPGTNTVVINVSLDSNGIPQQNYSEIELQPGQTALFAGPDELQIIFKNKKTPNDRIENRSENGVVAIKIPSGILEEPQFVEEYRRNHFLRFDYTISVNGKELDPPMKIGKNS